MWIFVPGPGKVGLGNLVMDISYSGKNENIHDSSVDDYSISSEFEILLYFKTYLKEYAIRQHKKYARK